MLQAYATHSGQPQWQRGVGELQQALDVTTAFAGNRSFLQHLHYREQELVVVLTDCGLTIVLCHFNAATGSITSHSLHTVQSAEPGHIDAGSGACAFSHNGQCVAVLFTQEHQDLTKVLVLDVKSCSLRHETQFSPEYYKGLQSSPLPSWACDDSMLTASDKILHMQDGSIIQIKRGPQENINLPAFHRRGRVLGYTLASWTPDGEQDATAVFVDTASGSELFRVEHAFFHQFLTAHERVLINPMLANQQGNSQIWQVWDLVSKAPLRNLPMGEGMTDASLMLNDRVFWGVRGSNTIYQGSISFHCIASADSSDAAALHLPIQCCNRFDTAISADERIFAAVTNGLDRYTADQNSAPIGQAFQVTLLRFC